MKKNVMLELHRSSEGNEKTIQELKSLMDLIMGDISVRDEPVISRTLVKLSYDPDLIIRRLNRKVGRHKAYLHENHRTLGNSVDISGKAEVSQIVQEIFFKNSHAS